MTAIILTGPPEHKGKLKYNEWELVVFDRADRFIVGWQAGRGNHGCQEYGTDLDIAMAACGGNDRACLYAYAPTGRNICLDRKKWVFWLKRWKEKSKK